MNNRQTKEVDGVKFTNVHSGQKRRYGDTFYEYEAVSDQPEDKVLSVLKEHAHKCELPREQWKKESPQSMDNHFRSSYEFKSLGNGKFLYSVMFPYAD